MQRQQAAGSSSSSNIMNCVDNFHIIFGLSSSSRLKWFWVLLLCFSYMCFCFICYSFFYRFFFSFIFFFLFSFIRFFMCGFSVFVHFHMCLFVVEKRKLVYPQAWSRRWKRFIRRYQSSFHSMTMLRGPIPSAPEGLSMSLPKIKYDLRDSERK